METILLILAFVGGITGLIIVGTRINLYFYSNGAIGVARSSQVLASPILACQPIRALDMRVAA